MKNEKKISFLYVIRVMISDIFLASPLWFIIDMVVNIIYTGMSVLAVFFTQKLFDSVEYALKVPGTYGRVFEFALLFGIIKILSLFTNIICMYAGTGKLTIHAQKRVYNKIQNKAASLDSISYEDDNILNLINKAKQGSLVGFGIYFALSTIISYFVPYFIFISVYLYSLHPILVAIIFVIFIPQVVIHVLRYKLARNLEDTLAPLRRKLTAYQSYMSSVEYFKETRAYNAFPIFQKKYNDVMAKYQKNILLYEKRSLKIGSVIKFITLIGYGSIILILVFCLMHNYISVGAFGAVFSNIGTLFTMMNGLVSNQTKRLTESIATTHNYVQFLDLPIEQKEDIFIRTQNIQVENVSFKYPFSNKYAIKNVSLNIKNGETVALVGKNGSGKSTLIKLLIGLYVPESGTIKRGGYFTKELSRNSIFHSTSIVMQNFQRYKMTLKENVYISSNHEEYDTTRVNQIFDDISLSLKQGYDTLLSRDFGGIDISGGQWQKIAIARGLYKKHDFVVLDEPTAAIDPINESKLYRQFANISKNCTAIICTHRIGSAKIADRIIVLDNGEISEIGNHKELMQRNGLYASMYAEQAKWYIDKNA